MKSWIVFRGSLTFCGEEMLNIFYDYSEKHYIDVYFNDVACLRNIVENKRHTKHNPIKDVLL